MKTVKVPATPGPTKQLCFQTPPLDGSRGNPMIHCDRAIHHAGRCTWDLERADEVAAAWLKVVQHSAKLPTDREPLGTWLDEREPLLEEATRLTKLYALQPKDQS